MLGWEFPPLNSGGLGIATKNIAESLAASNHDLEIDVVIPSFIYEKIKTTPRPEHYHLVNLKALPNLNILKVKSTLFSPYLSSNSYNQMFKHLKKIHGEMKELYGENIFAEIERFGAEVSNFVKDRNYDLIHAHDWITFTAGTQAQGILNAPLITHIHATEIDRTGNNPHPLIFQKELEGMQQADHIITVSDYTKNILRKHYHIPLKKITTIHNGFEKSTPLSFSNPKEKIVLFLGRITVQKGPDYFLEVAKKVVQKDPAVKFVLAGNGDLLPQIVHKIIEYKLQTNVFCVGHLNTEEKKRAFAKAALMIMPSVSEPFGLVALEAVSHHVPVLLCKQSGASEVVKNSLRADFWDINKMANQVLAVLSYPALSSTLSDKAKKEIANLTWPNQAQKISHLYHQLTHK